jgi:diacylglycerol kinase family enzyme
MPWWKILALFPTVYKGSHLQFREVSLEKVTAVSFEADREMLMNRDGETWPEKQGAISLIHEGLTVMCPDD